MMDYKMKQVELDVPTAKELDYEDSTLNAVYMGTAWLFDNHDPDRDTHIIADSDDVENLGDMR